jgi:hypothetical protein
VRRRGGLLGETVSREGAKGLWGEREEVDSEKGVGGLASGKRQQAAAVDDPRLAFEGICIFQVACQNQRNHMPAHKKTYAAGMTAGISAVTPPEMPTS